MQKSTLLTKSRADSVRNNSNVTFRSFDNLCCSQYMLWRVAICATRIDYELFSRGCRDVNGHHYSANWLGVDDDDAQKSFYCAMQASYSAHLSVKSYMTSAGWNVGFSFSEPSRSSRQLEVASQILARFSSWRGASATSSSSRNGRCPLPPSSLSSNPWWGHNLLSGSVPGWASSDRRVEWRITD